MEPSAPPYVDCEQYHTSIFVPDLAQAIEHYTRVLGFTLAFTWGEPEPVIAGVNLGRVQIFLERGTPRPEGCMLHFLVGDVDALYAYHQGTGAQLLGPPEDREYDVRDYAVRDPYGYKLDFGQHIFGRIGPPLEIERVDVPVRLEKRLAGLVDELAAYKRMSRDSLLEEILLHTCEQLGEDGVASPHTASQLRHIQKLKQKHGIDYDCHASYRFVEK